MFHKLWYLDYCYSDSHSYCHVYYHSVVHVFTIFLLWFPLVSNYRGADKSLARPGRKQATVTEDFEFHISYLLS